MLVKKIEFGRDAEVPADSAFNVLVKALLDGKDAAVHVHDPSTGAVNLGQIERIIAK